jgi:uncharacterized protein YnzC (UPF0291/DUF896 family)
MSQALEPMALASTQLDDLESIEAALREVNTAYAVNEIEREKLLRRMFQLRDGKQQFRRRLSRDYLDKHLLPITFEAIETAREFQFARLLSTLKFKLFQARIMLIASITFLLRRTKEQPLTQAEIDARQQGYPKRRAERRVISKAVFRSDDTIDHRLGRYE